MSIQRSKRSRRVNATDSDDNHVFEYQEGDLKTVDGGDGLDIEFRVRVLSDLLICPLCQGFFKEAMTIKECLHTFCKSCIILKFSNGVSSCPVCSITIAAHLNDAIQHDITIQNLVDKLFPHFSIQDEAAKEELMRLCDHTELTNQRTKSSALHVSDVSSKTLLSYTLKTKKYKYLDVTEEWLRSIIQTPEKTNLSVHFNLRIHLLPYEGSQPLLKPFLRTSGSMYVHQLVSYIAHKLNLSNETLELSIDGHTLGNSHTLEFACRSRRYDIQQCVPICFRLIPSTNTL